MKQSQPKIENGSDSYRVAFQKTENPIRRNTTPTAKRKTDKNKVRFGRPGFRSAGGGFGLNFGRFVILENLG